MSNWSHAFTNSYNWKLESTTKVLDEAEKLLAQLPGYSRFVVYGKIMDKLQSPYNRTLSRLHTNKNEKSRKIADDFYHIIVGPNKNKSKTLVEFLSTPNILGYSDSDERYELARLINEIVKEVMSNPPPPPPPIPSYSLTSERNTKNNNTKNNNTDSYKYQPVSYSATNMFRTGAKTTLKNNTNSYNYQPRSFSATNMFRTGVKTTLKNNTNSYNYQPKSVSATNMFRTGVKTTLKNNTNNNSNRRNRYATFSATSTTKNNRRNTRTTRKARH